MVCPGYALWGVAEVSKALAVVIPVALFLHWLAAGSVTVTMDGAPVAVPALAIVVGAVIAMSAAIVAVGVLLIRAERKTPAAWQTHAATPRAAGGAK